MHATPPPSPEALANDPSLRWCPYRRYELVWSDAHDSPMRFVSYTPEGRVRLATVNAMADLLETFEASSIRRVNA